MNIFGGLLILAVVAVAIYLAVKYSANRDQKRKITLHCMLDLETLSIAPNAYIRSVGAAFFDASGIGPMFYESCDGSEQPGADVDDATKTWWDQQSQSAKDALANTSQNRLIDTLESFSRWVYAEIHHVKRDNPQAEIDVWMWGNGADFDNVILTNAYKRVGVQPPWKWYNSRCYRTLKNLPSCRRIKPEEFSGEKHNALADARHQALHASRLLQVVQ